MDKLGNMTGDTLPKCCKWFKWTKMGKTVQILVCKLAQNFPAQCSSTSSTWSTSSTRSTSSTSSTSSASSSTKKWYNTMMIYRSDLELARHRH